MNGMKEGTDRQPLALNHRQAEQIVEQFETTDGSAVEEDMVTLLERFFRTHDGESESETLKARYTNALVRIRTQTE